MIVFVTTQAHVYTHKAVTKELPAVARRMSYETLLGKARLPRAVYIFTDMDRLAPAALAQASKLFGQLRAAGARVLNDPARIRSRWGLLRMFHDQGINRANAYRFDENVRPQRWPVFLGQEGDHRFPITDLLHSWEEVERAAEAAMQDGRPRSALIVAEYNAEPLHRVRARRLRRGERRRSRLRPQHQPRGQVHQSEISPERKESYAVFRQNCLYSVRRSRPKRGWSRCWW